MRYEYKESFKNFGNEVGPAIRVHLDISGCNTGLTLTSAGNCWFSGSFPFEKLEEVTEAISAIDPALVRAHMRIGLGHPLPEDADLIASFEEAEKAKAWYRED